MVDSDDRVIRGPARADHEENAGCSVYGRARRRTYQRGGLPLWVETNRPNKRPPSV